MLAAIRRMTKLIEASDQRNQQSIAHLIYAMNPKTILTRDSNTLSTEVDGEAVLMNVESGKYFNLDPIGSRIWSLLEKPISLAALQSQLLAQFEGDETTIRSESQSYIDDLITRGLVMTTA